MDYLVFHNDRIKPLQDVHLSPGQVGLLMGWGVFTTLRIYRGVPFAFERHWARMTRDAGRLAVPVCYEESAVRKAILELARANRRAEGMARVSLIKNQGGLWSQAEDRPPTDLLIFMRELAKWPDSHRLYIQTMGSFSAGQYAGAKMLSWAPHAAILERGRAEGYDDALLLNEKGHLVECTSANIFLVRGGKVRTPPLSSGCLAGITREILLETAPKLGVAIHEQDLVPEDLDDAEEVFVTSTTREVAGVGFISPGRTYASPGKVTERLEQAFQIHVRTYLDTRALAPAASDTGNNTSA